MRAVLLGETKYNISQNYLVQSCHSFSGTALFRIFDKSMTLITENSGVLDRTVRRKHWYSVEIAEKSAVSKIHEKYQDCDVDDKEKKHTHIGIGQ